MPIEKPNQNLENEKIGKDGEYIAEYQPTLDNLILNSETIEARASKDELNRMYDQITTDPKVSDYFSKELERPSIEEQVAHLKEGVEKAIKNARSSISKETLDKMITQLKGYEWALKNLNDQLSKRYDEDINVQMAIKKLDLIEAEMKNIDNKLEESVNIYKSNLERDPSDDIRPSLN